MTKNFRIKAGVAIDLAINGGFPWPARSGATAGAAYRFRSAARQAMLDRWPPVLRPLAVLAMTLCWPVTSFVEAFRMCRSVMPGRLEGRSRSGLFWWAWLLALRRSVPPVEALAYRLYEPGSAAPDHWWYTWEAVSLTGRLTDPSVSRLAGDKHDFSTWCASNGLRCIPTLALASPQGWELPFDRGEPPPRDLLLKPRRGSQGRGVEAWRWRDGRYHRRDRRLSVEEFAAHVLRRGLTEGSMVVQPLLMPHPQLAAIAGNGMPAARVVTGRWPDGRVELGLGMLQAPRPGEQISQSGPFRLIDVGTGEVLAPTARQLAPVFDVPPGEGFERILLPRWADAAALLVRAHGLLPGRAPIIGWDLLFDVDGPLICEANIGISYYFFQQADSRPVAATSLGRVMEAWL